MYVHGQLLPMHAIPVNVQCIAKHAMLTARLCLLLSPVTKEPIPKMMFKRHTSIHWGMVLRWKKKVLYLNPRCRTLKVTTGLVANSRARFRCSFRRIHQGWHPAEEPSYFIWRKFGAPTS